LPSKKVSGSLLIETDLCGYKSIIPGNYLVWFPQTHTGIGPKDSDFAEIIKSTNTGVF
jgi:hypothetical protein